MVRAIDERVTTVKAKSRQGRKQFSVVPIIGPSYDEPAYRLLEGEAMGAVRVTEVDESGSVPVLMVVNELDEMVYLMDGQELVGAKQNRVLNTDVLVPGKTTLTIPVSCVEAGRWHYSRPQFTPSRSSASISIRRNKMERIKENLKGRRGHDAVQGAVWDEVDQAMQVSGSCSRTGALSDAYKQRHDDLEKFRGELKLPEETVGLAVYRGETFGGLDLFDKRTTLRAFWQSLIDSYAIEWLYKPFDPVSPGEHPLEGELTQIMQQASGAKWQDFDCPGVGRDYRLEHEQLNGSALIWEERVVIHMQLFPQPGQVQV